MRATRLDPALVSPARAKAVFAAALVSVLGVTATACATTAETSPSPETAPASADAARVTTAQAGLQFPRTHQADRLLEVRVTTARAADALVTAVRLESPMFADNPARDSNVRLYQDHENRVRVPLGVPVCPAGDGDSTVVLTMLADGAEVSETVTVPAEVLAEINAAECVQQAVLDEAAPSFGEIESRDGAEVRTSLVLTRGTGVEPVTLERITGNIVFAIEVDEGAERTLAAGEAALAVPVTVTVARCDPHVFAESKKTFVFPVHLSVGEGEPQVVEFIPPGAVKDVLQAAFSACGPGG